MFIMVKYLYHFESIDTCRGWSPYIILIAKDDEEAKGLFKETSLNAELEIVIDKKDRKSFETVYLLNKIMLSSNEQSRILHIKQW